MRCTEVPSVQDGEPWRVPEMQAPDFGRRSGIAHPVQIWHDYWRHRDRVLRFMGRCIVCLLPTWAFDDGDNDPRGVLGDHAYWSTDLDYRGFAYDITTCVSCANSEARWRQAKYLAERELDSRRLGNPPHRLILIRRADS